ncbi:MAG: TadE/TadG family type IV pilus assembly protein [bacterium]|nr:TadE/TadG family type IV pilus assembly protein [bacterium]
MKTIDSRSLRGDEKGATMVEYAIVIGLFMTIMFGIIDLGMLILTAMRVSMEVSSIAQEVASAQGVTQTECNAALGAGKAKLTAFLTGEGIAAPGEGDGYVRVMLQGEGGAGHPENDGYVAHNTLTAPELAWLDTVGNAQSSRASYVEVYAKIPAGCIICDYIPSTLEFSSQRRVAFEDPRVCFSGYANGQSPYIPAPYSGTYNY